MLYLGIDQHKRQLTVNVRGEDGSVVLFDHVTVLIRRLMASKSLRLPASSMRPLDLATAAGRETDCKAARSPAGRSNKYYRCRADRARARTYLRSAGVHEGTGRGTVAC